MTLAKSQDKDFLVVARITALSGDAGFLKLKLLTDFVDKFRKLETVYVDFFGSMKELAVESIKGSDVNLMIKFRAFNSKTEAGVLIEKFIYIPESKRIELPAGTHFIHEYIGSEVVKNGAVFGVIKDFYSLKSNDVYVILKTDGSEYLLPAIEDFIDRFSGEEKRLYLKDGEEFYDED